MDECGIINGNNSTCLDCAGVVNGTSEDLGCGCGNPAAQEGYDCDGNEVLLLQLGDFAHGGIVFYVDETGYHGLVAATEDIGEMNWYSAMESASSATTNGYDDWYLPTINDFLQMHSTIGNGGANGNVGNLEDGYYWTSDESIWSSEDAWFMYFIQNDEFYSEGYHFDPHEKSDVFKVRTIRSF